MDHDQRLKVAVPGNLGEFADLAMPEGWPARFDLARAVWLPQEVFLDPPEGKRRVTDLAARVPLVEPLGPHDEALLHVEIESGDSVADLRRRMPEYRAGLRARYSLPVLSMALYFDVALGGVGWDEATHEMWGEQTDRARWRYVGLSGLDAERYVEGENVLGVALSVLMRSRPERHPWLKARAIERLARAGLAEGRRDTLVEIVEAYLPLVGPRRAEYEHLLQTEGFEMSRQLGLTSREEGAKQAIQTILEAKFGPLSSKAKERFEAMSAEQMKQLGLGLVSPKSLTELGLEDPPK